MKSPRKLVITILLISLAFSLSIPYLRAHAPDMPIHIHLTWQNDTSTTITVTWQTNSSNSGDIVLYDDVSRSGRIEDYRHNAVGINYTYSGASGYIHDVQLTGLSPDTTYYFICGGPTGGYSGERSFSTSPSVSSDVRFVMGGDSRTDWIEREKISVAMAKFNPAFVLHAGDMVSDGKVQSQWDSWFTDVDSNWIGENKLTIPIMPTLGNHEYPEYEDCKYFEQFALPGNERWFSLNWGPDIHIIFLDSANELTDASGPQRDWLENDLATHANYMWKFVVFHRPPFVSGRVTPWTPALTYWVPLFDKYHVDIVFNSHEHNYQRTYPLNWTASQTEPQDYSNGTMYIVSGGWGAPLYSPEPIWYMSNQKKTYHFCVVDVLGNGTLHLQVKDNLGNTIDEVIIHKLRAHAFQYNFQISPYSNVVHMDVDSSGWINGYMTGGATGWNPVLGKVVGDRAYIAIDMRPDGTAGPYETAFLVGTVSTLTGQLTLTQDGMSYDGPIDITIVPIAGPEEPEGHDIAEDSVSDIAMKAWYKLRLNPYTDIVHLNVGSSGWLNGYDEPNHPVLGFYDGNSWYLAVDGLDTPYTLAFNAGSLSTMQGKMIKTEDGTAYDGPHDIWLTEVTSPVEPVEGESLLKP